MSSTLRVRKVPKTAEGIALSCELKKIITERETIHGAFTQIYSLNRDYIQGLVDGGVKDADKLLELWDESEGELEFKLEW